MNQDQNERLSSVIHERITQLEELLSADSDTTEDGEVSTPDKLIENAVNTRITENEKVELKLLHNSLRWLEGDEAGYCSQCGDEIPIDRLLAVPVTQLCINCAK